jgi:hypothetical protein
MAKVKFISTTYLKENTTIQDNVDDNILVPFIYKAQDTHLQQILGTTFYNTLKNGIASGTTNSDEESLIRDYIQPMVCEWTLYEALPHINYKLTNKAVSQENSEFSQASSLDDIKYLRSSVRDMAEFYTKRLTKYLCDYSNLFPTYMTPDAKENLAKSSKSYFSGIYIPKNVGNSSIDGLRVYDDPDK